MKSAAAPYLVVASYRSEDYERSAFLAALRPEILARGLELQLAGLSDKESQELTERILPEVDGETGSEEEWTDSVAAIATSGAGNPLLLETLVFDRQRQPQSPTHPAPTSLGESGKPVSLRAILREQIDSLSVEAKALLEVLALAGMPISAELGRARCPSHGRRSWGAPW